MRHTHLRLVGGGHETSSGGKKSSAVTAPSVASRMRVATSRPGQPGSSEHSKVTYDGATPIRSAKSLRLVPVFSSQSRSLLMTEDYSAGLNFSQDENFSVALWKGKPRRKTLVAVPKQAAVRKRIEAPPEPSSPNHFVRNWRIHRGMTQETLAGLIGRSVSTISQLESGKQGPSLETLERIGKALNCRAGDLLSRDPKTDGALLDIWDNLDPPGRRRALKMLSAMIEDDEAA